WYFGRKKKSLRGFSIPRAHHAHIRSCIEGSVNLYSVEVLRVAAEVVGGSQTLRIEGSQPPCGCERRGPAENRRMVHGGEYSEHVSYTARSDGNFRFTDNPRVKQRCAGHAPGGRTLLDRGAQSPIDSS